jgi:hypothetical protein
MGTKIRSFSPLPDELSLEDLVPEAGWCGARSCPSTRSNLKYVIIVRQ